MLPIGGDGEGVDVGTGDGPHASTEDGDGVDAGTGDGPCALTWDEDGLASVGGGDGVGATSGDLTGIDTEDGDGVDDVRLSWGGNSLTMYHLFFVVVRFLLESCDGGRGGSMPLDNTSLYRKIILYHKYSNKILGSMKIR